MFFIVFFLFFFTRFHFGQPYTSIGLAPDGVLSLWGMWGLQQHIDEISIVGELS